MTTGEDDRADKYHILVAVGEQHEQNTLLKLGCTLAASNDGHITLLCITPSGERPPWLAGMAECGDIPLSIQVRADDQPGEAILDVVQELDPELLLMGWSGEAGSRRYLLGSTLDPVTRYAPCNIVVVRADRINQVRHVLVPAAGGPNATLAIEVALRLSPDVRVTALNIVRQATGPVGIAAGHEQLTRILEPWIDNDQVTAHVVRSRNIIDGILSQAGTGYDMLLMGASNESYIDRKLFGNVPQTVAASSPIPTLIVRRRAGPIKSVLRRAERALSGVQDYLTMAERVEAYREIRRGARPHTDFFAMIGFAAAIATMGLLMNSPAVIIGAMVIAPLMSAIFGVSLGIVQGDARLLWQAAGTTLRGVGLAILIGAIIGWISPLDAPTAEILSRTQPTLTDLVVALVSGTAGAYAQCRRNVLGALAGVAIAVALIPPLVTTGIGIIQGNGLIAGGAFLLFLTNLSAITAAGSVVFLLFGFRPDPGKRIRVFGRSMVGLLILLGIVSTILTLLTINTLLEHRTRQQLQTTIGAELEAMSGVELANWHITGEEGETLHLSIEVRAVRPITYQETVDLQDRIEIKLGRPVALRLSVTQVSQLEPGLPPTPTPAPQS